MLKKTITFKDLDGNDVTEDFYFNLNKGEIAEMELSYQGGLSEHLQKIIASEDGAEIIASFKDIIKKAVGKRSEDGRRFIKNQEIIDDFIQTDAYSEMFMELVTNAEKSIEFIRGIVPAEMSEKLDNVTNIPLPYDESEQPAWVRENREPNEKEIREMSPEQLRDAFQRKNVPQASQ